MSLFINYVAHPERTSPFNLTMSRIIISIYGIWKVATYPFRGLSTYPAFAFTADAFTTPVHFLASIKLSAGLIAAEQAAVCILLVMFGLGWRTGLSAFLAAILLSHIAGLNYLLVNEKTFLPIIYFLIFFALFRDEEKTPVRGEDASPGRYRMTSLALFLVVLSLIYFFTGWAKVKGGGLSLAWAEGANIKAILHHNSLYHIHTYPDVTSWLLSRSVWCSLLGISTLLLELGFVVAVLGRLPITPFVIGLAGMHAGIVLTMQVNYLSDMAALYLIFLPWDDWTSRWRAS